MTLKRRNGTFLLPPQTHRAFYVRKWGGSSRSHMPGKIRQQIVNDFQQDETFEERFFSEVDRTSMALEDPATYFSEGLNLKKNHRVPLTSMDLMIRLSKQTSKRYLKQISPFEEKTVLELMPGNETAVNLIHGNAYQEAITYLQGLDQLSFEDLYNLGLAYEANGEIGLAMLQFETA